LIFNKRFCKILRFLLGVVILLQVLCTPYTKDVENYISRNYDLNKKILHIVPTLLLYRSRLRYISYNVLSPYLSVDLKKQDWKKIENEIRKCKNYGLYEMDQFIKEMIYERNMNIVTKSETTILIERILKNNEQTNNLAWTSSIYNLRSLFFDFSVSGLSIDDIFELNDSSQWDFLCKLYKEYLNELNLLNKIDYGIATKEVIDTLDLSKYDELVLDGGFLPILPKHHKLIMRFLNLGKPVTFIIPIDLDNHNSPVYQAIKTIYSNYVPFENWKSIKNNIKSSTFFINQLPINIFKEDVEPIKLDPSFNIYKFSTVEEEFDYVIRVSKYIIKEGLASYRDIVIVTPNPMAVRPYIREIADQYGLNVQIPKRPLTHLPTGRGIKILYDIFTTEKRFNMDHYFDLDMFKDLLYANLIRHTTKIQKTFSKVEVFFTDCKSFNDWYKKIEDLFLALKHLNKEKHKFHPLRDVNKKQLLSLLWFIKKIEDLYKALMTHNKITIKEHVNFLISYLKNHRFLNQIDEEIFERINKMIEINDSQENILISYEEFGKRISIFFNDSEDEESFDNSVERYKNKEILVTGPNNIEFQNYKYVFVCQFTQDHYPQPRKYNWPYNMDFEKNYLKKTTNINFETQNEINKFYLDLALYYFNVILQSPQKRLTITYSGLNDGVQTSPSHYLHDIAKVFGIEEGNRLENPDLPNLEQLLEKYGVLKSLSDTFISDETIDETIIDKNVEINELSIEDLTVFKFCPRRFYYEKKYVNERFYREPFHIKNYAASLLYEEAVKVWVKKYSSFKEDLQTKRMLNRLKRESIEFIKEAEEKIKGLFPLSLREWKDIQLQTLFNLQSLFDQILDENNYLKELGKNGRLSVNINLTLNYTPVERIVGNNIKVIGIRELSVEYNGRMKFQYSISNLQGLLGFKSANKDEDKRTDEIKKWYFNLKRNFIKNDQTAINEINQLVSNITKDKYEKVIGGHCLYCNFSTYCRKREMK